MFPRMMSLLENLDELPGVMCVDRDDQEQVGALPGIMSMGLISLEENVCELPGVGLMLTGMMSLQENVGDIPE